MTTLILILFLIHAFNSMNRAAPSDPNEEYERQFWHEWNNLKSAPGKSADVQVRALVEAAITEMVGR